MRNVASQNRMVLDLLLAEFAMLLEILAAHIVLINQIT